MNYFEPDWVAGRYATSRPDIHSDVAGYIREVLAPPSRVDAALDVGCGTGLSTRPLATLAKLSVGIDPSPGMLREARQAGGPRYVRGFAEDLPFQSGTFDLVTIGCAYHWCQPEGFLSAAQRVLRSDGHLVIYDNFFFGQSPRSPALFDWLSSEHWARLPRTPRNPLPEVGEFHHPGFELIASSFLEMWIPMSRETLVTYLTTQSVAVAAVESGERTLEGIEAFLREGLARLIPEETTDLRFAGPIWVVKPRGAA